MITEKRTATIRKKYLDTKQFAIEPNIALTGTGYSRKKVCFFDEDMVFRVLPLEDAYGKIESVNTRIDGSCFSIFERGKLIGNNDQVLFYKAISRMKEGEPYEKFLSICQNVRYEVHNSNPRPWIDRFIAEIEKPYIERETDNFKENTFDFIRIRVHLNHLQVDTKEAVKKYYPQIMELVLQKIEKNKAFQKYNVPVNFLHVTSAVLTRQRVLEIIFELKETSKDDKDK